MMMIPRAVRFAEACHRGQVRKVTGDPYIVHPLRVADMVSWHDVASDHLVAAAYLHDVMEDCGITFNDIAAGFDVRVARYVEWMTNTSNQSHPTARRSERKKIDRERITQAPDEIKILKLIDRVDNLREIGSDNFARLYAAESRLLCDAIGAADEWWAEQLLAECKAIEKRCG